MKIILEIQAFKTFNVKTNYATRSMQVILLCFFILTITISSIIFYTWKFNISMMDFKCTIYFYFDLLIKFYLFVMFCLYI